LDENVVRYLRQIISLGLIIGWSLSSFALDSASVLPQGINSPAFKYGVVSGLNEKFSGDGSLFSLSDLNSVEFDANTLKQINPRTQELIDTLNQFGTARIGDQINLGVLKVEAEPELSYMAPIYAYGVSSKLTLAFALPIFKYKNTMKISRTSSNIAVIRSQFASLNSTDLNNAFDQLDVNLVDSFHAELDKKGYKPIRNVDESIIGDAQLVGLYQFMKSLDWQALSKTTLHLPTGRPDDPDDLIDLGIFGQSAVEEQGVVEWKSWSWLSLAAKASYRLNIPDKVEKRVPTSSTDTLPDATTKEEVSRDSGDLITTGLSSLFKYKRFGAGTGVEYSMRGKDRISGSRGSRYDLLEKDTDSEWTKVRLGCQYTSVEAYLNKSAAIPLIVAYEYNQVVTGRNIENQSVHEIWLTLFF
jgi:hypothetical protein